MGEYTVKGSDHLSSIAIQQGLFNFATLWEHNKAKLKEKQREDPNVLFHGDRVVPKGDEFDVPDVGKKPKDGSADQVNKFQVPLATLWLRLRIVNNDFSPVKGAKYSLTIPDVPECTGKTDDSGHIEIEIPDYFKKRDSAYARTAALVVRVKAQDTDGESADESDDQKKAVKPKPVVRGEVPVQWSLKIGRLNPILEIAPDERCVSGVQARLNNLNFNTGPVDGMVGPNTTAAVIAFKTLFRIGSAQGKEGQPNHMMQTDLKRVHDGEKPVSPPAKDAPVAPPLLSESNPPK